MSDELSDIGLPQEPVDETAEAVKSGGFKGFMSTTAGKVVVIGGAVGILLVVLLAVGLALLAFLGSGPGDGSEDAVISRPVIPVEATQSLEATSPAEPVTNADVFAFRDPFQPLLVKGEEAVSSATTPTSSATTGEGATTGGTTTGESSGDSSDDSSDDSSSGGTNAGTNTLLLEDIITENGKLKAVLVWEDTTYVLAAGGTIPDTAWKVLSVSETQVVMLYGDEQVVLSIGQGVKK